MMATVTQSPIDPGHWEGRLVLHNVAWDEYEAMLEIVGDRHIRVTYDQGTMEVAMPSQRHEQATQLFGLFVPRLAEELEIPYEPLGMTTWRKPDVEKGLEADQCYYIQNQAVVRNREVLNLDVDPPPDLAIEVDISSSSLNRMEIYAGLGSRGMAVRWPVGDVFSARPRWAVSGKARKPLFSGLAARGCHAIPRDGFDDGQVALGAGAQGMGSRRAFSAKTNGLRKPL